VKAKVVEVGNVVYQERLIIRKIKELVAPLIKLSGADPGIFKDRSCAPVFAPEAEAKKQGPSFCPFFSDKDSSLYKYVKTLRVDLARNRVRDYNILLISIRF
jgi:hypothetical protein